MDTEEFAAGRGRKLSRADDRIRPLVAASLPNYGDAGWDDAIVKAASALWLDIFEAESPSGIPDAGLAKFVQTLRESLQKTSAPETPPSDAQVQRITKWIGTFSVNDATLEATRSNGAAQKQWITRGDDTVRPMHSAANGQVVRLRGKFQIGEYELRYPGEPVGPPEVWIECRCLMRAVGRRRAMTASGDEFEDRTSVVIVALPAETDPIVAASSEDIPHITMVWLGDVSELTVDIEDVKADLANWAAGVGNALIESISGTAVLGKESVSVVLIDASALAQLRNGMVNPDHESGTGEASAIRAAYLAAEQFPTWIPHVTLGYPETPQLADYSGTEITFDRFALWVGDDRTEYPFGGAMTAAAVTEAEPEVEDDETEDDVDTEVEIPFHGVAVPIGYETGDRRQLGLPDGTGASWRPLPFVFSDRHDGPEIGSITMMWVDEKNLLRYKGMFRSVRDEPLVSGAIARIIDGSCRGVSVDIDMVTMQAPDTQPEFADDASAIDAMLNPPADVVSSFRVAGLAMVAIPAYAESYIALGEEDCVDCQEPVEEEPESLVAAAAPSGARTEAQRGLDWHADGKGGSGLESATLDRARKIAAGDDLTDDHIRRMHSYFARHEVDKKGKGFSPGEGYPSAGRVAWALWGGDAGKSFADAQFKRIQNEADADTEQFAVGTKDGPGWITDPVPTARLRRYWTKGVGAAKIKWGVPGDFNRCRTQLAKYITNPDWLAGACANMHKEALGVWPGRENGAFTASAIEPERAEPFYLVAAVEPPVVIPSREWFENPQLTGPTPLTVTEEGRVFGHVATWGSCHIGLPGCESVPYSMLDYALFRTGLLRTTDGDVAVGQLTMSTGHASRFATAAAAAEHYDNTGAAVADVATGEDSFGIWMGGAVRETTTPLQVKQLRASGKVSGDWRRFRGNLEMVGVLVVNVPGFQTPRTAMAASGAEPVSLVAANMVEREEKVDVTPGLIDAVIASIDYRTKRTARLSGTKQTAGAIVRAERIKRLKGKQ